MKKRVWVIVLVCALLLAAGCKQDPVKYEVVDGFEDCERYGISELVSDGDSGSEEYFKHQGGKVGSDGVNYDYAKFDCRTVRLPLSTTVTTDDLEPPDDNIFTRAYGPQLISIEYKPGTPPAQEVPNSSQWTLVPYQVFDCRIDPDKHGLFRCDGTVEGTVDVSDFTAWGWSIGAKGGTSEKSKFLFSAEGSLGHAQKATQKNTLTVTSPLTLSPATGTTWWLAVFILTRKYTRSGMADVCYAQTVVTEAGSTVVRVCNDEYRKTTAEVKAIVSSRVGYPWERLYRILMAYQKVSPEGVVIPPPPDFEANLGEIIGPYPIDLGHPTLAVKWTNSQSLEAETVVNAQLQAEFLTAGGDYKTGHSGEKSEEVSLNYTVPSSADEIAKQSLQYIPELDNVLRCLSVWVVGKQGATALSAPDAGPEMQLSGMVFAEHPASNNACVRTPDKPPRYHLPKQGGERL